MNLRTFAVASAASLLLSAGGAFAGTVDFGTYEILNAQTDADGSGAHGVYLVGFLPAEGGQDAYDAKRWSILDGSATVSESGLSFSADLVSSVNDDYGFKLVAGLDPIGTPTKGDPGPECSGNCTDISDDLIRYYNKDGAFASLVGTGDLSGMMINLFVNDVHDEKPAQLGLGGSWFQANKDQVGFATWLHWEVVDAGGLSGFGSSGAGDINWLLGLSDNSNDGDTGVVPLPAAGWLMIAGLGGLAAMRRRQVA